MKTRMDMRSATPAVSPPASHSIAERAVVSIPDCPVNMGASESIFKRREGGVKQQWRGTRLPLAVCIVRRGTGGPAG